MQIPLYAVFDKQINLCSPHAQQCVGHLLQAVRSVHRVSGSRGKCQIRGLNPQSTATVYNSKAVDREDEVETMQKSLSSGEAQVTFRSHLWRIHFYRNTGYMLKRKM